MDVEGGGRLSVHDVVYWTLRGFVCVQVGRFKGGGG